MPKEWTQERRAAQAETMRQRHEKRRNQQPDTNPPASEDIVREDVSAPHAKRVHRGEETVRSTASFSVDRTVNDLQSLPLDDISYADCGTLLNTLSAASTAVALRRRQAQEQMETGPYKAKCACGCGRVIDISKSGGFQILTERDEHFQPVNRYYATQNCLLSKNMPSHRVKKLPGDVGAKA